MLTYNSIVFKVFACTFDHLIVTNLNLIDIAIVAEGLYGVFVGFLLGFSEKH